MQAVRGKALTKNTTVSKLAKDMESYGLQATQVSRGATLLRTMQKEQATIFLACTSNIMSSGLREVVADLVKRKKVDAIITTVGAVEEDLMKTKKDFLVGSFEVDDRELNKKGVNRIGNIFVPNDRYTKLEDMLQPFFKQVYKEQVKTNRMISPSELIFKLGSLTTDKNSVLYWATKNKIPIFCPAITDGALGLNVFFFKQKHPLFGIDVTADMQALADLTLTAKKTGALILGGGIAKHHTLGINLLRDGLDYAVYVSTGTEYDGSLSGARPKEAVSWSKLKKKSHHVFVEADASIVLPLLVAGW